MSIDDTVRTIAKQDAVVYKKAEPFVYSLELKKITDFVHSCEQKLIALYPAFWLIEGKELECPSERPFVYSLAVKGNSHIIGRSTPQDGNPLISILSFKEYFGIYILPSTNATYFCIGLKVGHETRKRKVQKTTKKFLFTKTQEIEEEYISNEINLHSIEVMGSVFDEKNTFRDKLEYKTYEFADWLTESVYGSENISRTQKAEFYLELFSKLPGAIARKIIASVDGRK